MIGGLQGDFGDLDNKYLKQNIPKYRSKISQDVGRKYLKMSVGNISRCRSKISGSFRRTPWYCILRENSPGKCYQRIQTCLTGEVETSSSPIRRQAADVKYPDKVERWSDRIQDVRYPEKVERRLDRIPDVRYPEKVERRPDRILPRVE